MEPQKVAMTKEEKAFVEKVFQHRTEQVERLAYFVLGLALKEDVNIVDMNYIVIRLRKAIGDAVEKIDYNNEKLVQAQKAYLKELLKQVQKNYEAPGNITAKKPDETDKRDKRCEPIVKEMVKMMTDEELIFSDDGFFEAVIPDSYKNILYSSIRGYIDALEDKMLMIDQMHWRNFLKNLIGVYKEDITFSIMDEVLKRDTSKKKS